MTLARPPMARLTSALAALAAAVGVAAGPAAPPALAADRWTGGTASTVGRIIWDAGNGQLGYCSGAIVDAPNGSVVATAAHCLRTPDHPSPPADAWFVPAYDHGLSSYQRDGWRITAHHTPEEWDVSREMPAILPHDYAFVTVEEKDGRTIQERHGANRLAFEPVPEGEDVQVLGYPAVEPYDGESLRYCAGVTTVLREGQAEAANAGGLLLENCDLTAGSSGGPWLTGFDPATESGTVVAVMSVGSGRGHVVGRPFPATARTLLERAGAPAS